MGVINVSEDDTLSLAWHHRVQFTRSVPPSSSQDGIADDKGVCVGVCRGRGGAYRDEVGEIGGRGASS